MNAWPGFHGGSETKPPEPINGNQEAQKRASGRFMDLNTVDPRITLTTYYSMFGDSSFDSAVVSPQYRPTAHNPNKTLSLDGKTFRTIYCYLTNDRDKVATRCPATEYFPPPP